LTKLSANSFYSLSSAGGLAGNSEAFPSSFLGSSFFGSSGFGNALTFGSSFLTSAVATYTALPIPIFESPSRLAADFVILRAADDLMPVLANDV
jgi:hypothetical protein